MQKYTKGKVYRIAYCIYVKTKENIQSNNEWLDIGKKLSLKTQGLYEILNSKAI